MTFPLSAERCMPDWDELATRQGMRACRTYSPFIPATAPSTAQHSQRGHLDSRYYRNSGPTLANRREPAGEWCQLKGSPVSGNGSLKWPHFGRFLHGGFQSTSQHVDWNPPCITGAK